MIITLLLTFGFILLFVLFRTENRLINIIVFCFIAIFLIVVAGTRPPNVDKDYSNYLSYWRDPYVEVELSFKLLKNFLKHTLNLPFTSLIFVYAVIGVYTNLRGIKKLSSLFYLSCLLFVSHYFLLHELTQIRVGVAAGFLLISLYYLAERHFLQFLVLVITAGFFHYSAFLALPLWFIYDRKDKLTFYALLLPMGYVIYYLGFDLIVNIPVPYIQEKVKLYKEVTESGFIDSDKINIFNYVYLIRIVVFYILFFFSSKIEPHVKYIYLLLKIYAISLFAFTALAAIPSFAFRVSELLGIIEIIIFPYLIYIFKNKNFGILTVIIMALTFLLLDLFYAKLIL